ncbi:MAG: hypothetical protein AB1758_08410, partial [Candidatus Eremiobacterota bacterium]
MLYPILIVLITLVSRWPGLSPTTAQAWVQGVLPLALGLVATFDALLRGARMGRLRGALARPALGLVLGLTVAAVAPSDRGFEGLLAMLTVLPYYASVGILLRRLCPGAAPPVACLLFAAVIFPPVWWVHPAALLPHALVPW